MAFRTLFGRARELGDLEAALERARQGQGSIFLLSGEAGIGKTRLTEEVAERAQQQGIPVFWGRAWEVEGAPSCWPWVQVLSACVQTERGAVFMSDPRARDLGLLLLDERSTGGSQDPEREWLRLGSAIVALLQRMASERPLVLVFDDLHASDLTSLNLLLVVARALRGLPALVMGTYRELEARRSPRLASLLGKLGREGTVRPLGRLDHRAVTEWVAGALGTEPAPALASAVFATTEGNPLFVDALSHLLASRGGGASLPSGFALPDTIRETLQELLARLSPGAREVLDAAAVLGRECAVTALQLVAEKPVEQVLAAVGESARAGVVGAQVRPSDPVRFTHVLIREALYQELSASRRIELHAGAVRALGRLHTADVDAHLAELAHHSFESAAIGSWDAAADFSTRAARRAMSLFAFDDAAKHFERALVALDHADSPAEDARRAELLWRLGASQIRLGQARAGKEACERSAELAMHAQQPEIYVRAALAHSLEPTIGRVDARAVELLESALQMGVTSEALRVQVMARLAAAMTPTPFREKPLALAREAMTLARTLGDRRVLAEVLSAARAAFGPADDLGERIALDRELGDLAASLGDKLLGVQAHTRLALAAVEQGARETMHIELSALERLADETRVPQHQLSAAAMCLLRASGSGDAGDIERREAEVRALTERVDTPPGLGKVTLEIHRSVRAELRDDAAAEDSALEALVALCDTYPWLAAWPPMIWWLTFRRAALHGEPHQIEEARALLRQFFGTSTALPPPLVLALATPACIRLGEREQIQVLYESLVPFAGRYTVLSGFFISLGPVSHHLGCLAAALGRLAEAGAHFREAVMLGERSGFTAFAARARRSFEALSTRDPQGGARWASASRSERALVRVGTVIRQFRIDRLLGIGGMGSVYAARRNDGQRVAIKFMHERLLDDPAALQLFHREASIANQVGHAGAIPVLGDDVDDDGCPFLVMPLLEGETLRARWERTGKRLPISEVAVLMADVLDVLGCAHAKGIVHRDIKPENLFVTAQGRGCVLDFGIARRLDLEGSVTMSGHMIGTPAFMPPEQAMGNRNAIGPHSDCWAVGATIFSLLTGENVHQADNAAAQLAAAATKHARSLAGAAPHLPRSLVAFVDKALSFEPANRWPSATEMRSALLDAFGEALGESVSAVEARIRGAFVSQLSHGDEGTLRNVGPT